MCAGLAPFPVDPEFVGAHGNLGAEYSFLHRYGEAAAELHSAVRLVKDLAYFGLVLAALPFTLAEAACHAGSTMMIEARKR
jgi:hypothetical protein